MITVADNLEVLRQRLGATTVCLLRSTAGILGLVPPMVVGNPMDPGSMGDALASAIPVPAQSSSELAQRLVSLEGQKRRSTALRPALRLVLPFGGGAHLLVIRGEAPVSAAGLVLALDALAAHLRPGPQPQELAEACAFLREDGRLAMLVDREGRPLGLTPLMRRALGGDRSGRPFWLPEERRTFFEQLQRQIELGVETAEVEGLELPATLRTMPFVSSDCLLVVVEGDAARATALRALASGSVTPRELACGLRLAEGKSYRSIADELGVSPDTVKLHLRALYQKLAVDGRDSLVARMAGFAPPPPLVRRAG